MDQDVAAPEDETVEIPATELVELIMLSEQEED